MPTYNYMCKGCGREFERFQTITAKLLRRCPYCNKNKLQRLIGAGGGFIFKGEGFYCNDYKKKTPKKRMDSAD